MHGSWGGATPNEEKKYFITVTRASETLWHSTAENKDAKTEPLIEKLKAFGEKFRRHSKGLPQMPDPPRAPIVMTDQPSTRSRSRALGQAQEDFDAKNICYLTAFPTV